MAEDALEKLSTEETTGTARPKRKPAVKRSGVRVVSLAVIVLAVFVAVGAFAGFAGPTFLQGSGSATSSAVSGESASSAAASQTSEDGVVGSAGLADSSGQATAAEASDAAEQDQGAVFDSSIDDPQAFGGAPYESGVVLAKLASGAQLGDVTSQVAGLLGTEASAVEAVGDNYVQVQLPEGMSVAEAVEALQASDVLEGAQPNYRYFTMEGDEAAGLTEASETTEMAGASGATGMAATTAADAGSGASGTATATALADAGDEAGTAVSTVANQGAGDGASPALQASVFADVGVQGWDVDDRYAASQWALDSIKAYDAWEVARADNPQDGQGIVTVAVLDDMFNVDHEDLKDNIAVAYNAVTQKENDAMSGSSAHGTHVAGIIAAQANNGKGVAGVSYNARLMPVRVSTSSGGISTAYLLRAYEFVFANAEKYNVRVVNISLGAPLVVTDDDGEYQVAEEWDSTSDDAVLDMIDEAWSRGIVTVTSAGNAGTYDLDGDGTRETNVSAPFICWPGDYAPCVNVIALEQIDGDVSRYGSSNYNLAGMTTKDIAAPGAGSYTADGKTLASGIYSTKYSSYGVLSGTSMASPCVAGVLALEFTADPDLSAEEAVSKLYATAADVGASGWDNVYGYGEVDAFAVVSAAEESEAYLDILADVQADTAKSNAITRSFLEKTSYKYNGQPRTPSVIVHSGLTVLQEGKDYAVTYANNVKAGTASATVTGLGEYAGATKTLKFTITKAANTLTVKAKSPTVKYAKVRKAKQKIARKKALRVSGAIGKLTYTKLRGSKYLTIAKKTGAITVRKGTPRGTYKIKVKVRAAGNKNYKARTRTVTVRIKVK